MHAFCIHIENQCGAMQRLIQECFVFVHDVGFYGVKRVASSAVFVVVANVSKQRIRSPTHCGQVCSFGHVAVVVHPVLLNLARVDVEWGRYHSARSPHHCAHDFLLRRLFANASANANWLWKFRMCIANWLQLRHHLAAHW